MLHMEHVRRVMRPQVMVNVRQKTWCLVTRRLDHMALERSEGVLHPLVSGVVIPRLGWLLREDRVTDRLNGHQVQTAGKGFILHDRDVLRRHALSQTLRLLTAVSHYGCFNTPGEALLRPQGRPHKSMQPHHLQKETDQTNPTRAHFDKHPR